MDSSVFRECNFGDADAQGCGRLDLDESAFSAERSKLSVIDNGDGVGDECEDFSSDRAFEAAEDFLGSLAFLLLTLNVVAGSLVVGHLK